MKSIKRIAALIIAAACLVLIALPAFADLIIDPYGDSFYKKHMDECELGDYRTYFPAGEGGIAIYDEPEGKVITTLDAGVSVATNCVYRPNNGDAWGYSYGNGTTHSEGWFRLADTVRIYDRLDFERDHASEIKEYEGEPAELTNAVLYGYPGGPVSWNEWSSGEPISFSECYTDAQGRLWGFIGYHLGRVNSWVCIDEPENAELSATEAPAFDAETGEVTKVINLSAAEDTEDDRESAPRQTLDPNADPDQHMNRKKDGASPWLIGGIVAAAAAVCAAVLAVCFKKRSGGK